MQTTHWLLLIKYALAYYRSALDYQYRDRTTSNRHVIDSRCGTPRDGRAVVTPPAANRVALFWLRHSMCVSRLVLARGRERGVGVAWAWRGRGVGMSDRDRESLRIIGI